MMATAIDGRIIRGRTADVCALTYFNEPVCGIGVEKKEKKGDGGTAVPQLEKKRLKS
jgi:hypothetical protein